MTLKINYNSKTGNFDGVLMNEANIIQKQKTSVYYDIVLETLLDKMHEQRSVPYYKVY